MNKKCGVLAVFTVILLIVTGFGSMVYGDNDDRDFTVTETLMDRGNTLYVGGAGPGNYSTIQSAIDNASNGDTVLVYNGTYNETVNVSKSLTIQSKYGPQNCIVQATDLRVFLVSVNHVNIYGLTVKSAQGYNVGGIGLFDVDYCNISNNIAINNSIGISLTYSNNNIFTNNNILSCDTGIRLWSANDNILINNTIINDNAYGNAIYIEYGSYNTVANNTLANAGLYVQRHPQEPSYDNYIENNTVNGKPLIYLEDVTNHIITNAGQVVLANCDNITVENLNLSRATVGVLLWETSNSTIKYNDVSYNRWGIESAYSNNNIIMNNTLKTTYSAAIHLLHSCNNTISNHNASGTVAGLSEGILLQAGCNNNILSNNTAMYNNIGIRIQTYCNNNTIRDNNANSNWGDGIELWSISNNNVLSNNIAINNGGTGIRLDYSENNMLIKNTVSNNGDNGIQLTGGASNNTVSNNIISNNTYGIYLSGCSNNILSNNTVTSNTYGGIGVGYSTSNHILTSNIVSHNGDGIRLDSSSNNTLTSNTVDSNIYNGIVLWSYSNDNIFYNNNVSNNNFGIYLYSSCNNIIYLNNFNDNTINAKSGGIITINFWNSTSQISYTYGGSTYTNYMGNYWDDYTGSDSDGDGIGDNPYNINTDGNDYYPLIDPIENYNIGGEISLEAHCHGPYSGLVGDSIQFTGSATGGTPPYTYKWDFDYNGYFTVDSTLQNPAWTFTSPGVCIVALRVTDDIGATAMCTTTATITRPAGNDRPTCVIELQKDGNTISDIDVEEFFDIYVGDSSDPQGDQDIVEVRFSSDEKQNGVREGSWTDWYPWNSDVEDWTGTWDGDDKIKTWLFVGKGPREVWAEIKDTEGLTHMARATIMANPWFFVHITDPHVEEDHDTNWHSILQYLANVIPRPKFVLCTGDIVNYGQGIWGPNNYAEAVDDLYQINGAGIFYIDSGRTIPIYFCPGNHDARDSWQHDTEDLSNYYTYIGNYYNSDHPNYYNIAYKNCRIFSMNSGYDFFKDRNIGHPEGDGLYDDEYNDFSSEVAQAKEGLKFVMVHHPYKGANDENPEDGAFLCWRDPFIQKCNTYGVGTVFCGHLHDGGSTKVIGTSTVQCLTNAVYKGQVYRPIIVGSGEGRYHVDSMQSLEYEIHGTLDYCPVNLHIIDELGNHNGPSGRGEIDWQIPGSFYSIWKSENDTNTSYPTYIEFSLPKNDTKNYTFIFEGLANGSMNMTLGTSLVGGEWINAVYSNVTMYNGSVGTTYANGSIVDYSILFVDPGRSTRVVIPSNMSNNDPPEIDVLSAPPQNIIASLEYSFTVNATDNNNESVYYLFDWGDGNISDWLGPYTPGEPCTVNYSWGQGGCYVVKVQPKDDYSLMGNWSEGIAINVTGIDSICITYDTEDEVPDMGISPNFQCVLSASAFNITSGFLQPIKVGWTVNNTGCVATLNSTYGDSSLLSSGPLAGTITVSINDGYGHSDTVVLTVNASTVSSMFYEGWNLVTVPFDNMWTAETLGENISGCSVVTLFESSTQIFLSHVVGTPHDDFPIMDGVGYFVYCTRNSFLSFPDISIPGVNVIIHEDWNIIGWYHEYLTNAKSLGGNISGCSVVTMFDARTQTFFTHVVGVPHDNFLMERGMGLFIYTSEASIWHGEG